MSLTPFVRTPRFETYIDISKTILFDAYVMMSRLSENRYESDLIDHFFKIDSNVWLTFGISLLILYVMSFVQKLTFKRLRQIDCWFIIKMILNQGYFNFHYSYHNLQFLFINTSKIDSSRNNIKEKKILIEFQCLD